MPTTIKIPRFTDREAVLAFDKVRSALKPSLTNVQLKVYAVGQEWILAQEKPEDTPTIQFLLEPNGYVVKTLSLIAPGSPMGPQNHQVVEIAKITRKLDLPHDEVQILDDNIGNIQDAAQKTAAGKIAVTLNSAVTRECHSIELWAATVGANDSEWGRYRAAQQEVLNSLQKTAERVISEAAKHAESERQAEAKRNEALRHQISEESTARRLADEAATLTRSKALDQRQVAMDEAQKAYDLRSAGLVARARNESLLGELKKWTEGWNLPKGTQQKRTIVTVNYYILSITLLALAVWTTANNAPKFSTQMPWWQWVLITIEPAGCLVGFVWFMTYFIRWSSEWARQHAEEDFRNRSRYIDIGRSGWLFEAVRDSQGAAEKGLPAELIQELSKNLFAYHVPGASNGVNPQTPGGHLLDRIGSLTLKTPTGEAAITSKK